jgi:hypothetical protein
MNINWGLLPDPLEAIRDKALRRETKLIAAKEAFEDWTAKLR